MTQLGEVVRDYKGGDGSFGGRLRGGMKALVLFTFSTAAVVTTTAARAQSATADDKADCMRRLDIAEKIIAKDAYYAHAWTDSWYMVGTTSACLLYTSRCV